MDDDLLGGLHLLVLQLLALDAVVHFEVIWPRLVAVMQSGTYPRVATTLMLLAVLAVVAGVVAFRLDLVSRRTLYLAGVALVLGQLFAWFVYHNVQTANFGHSHGTGPFAFVTSTWEHLTDLDEDPLETVSKVAEVIALGLLLVLLRVDPRARSGERSRALGDHETDVDA
ncbi:hypothetical protein [Halomarina rubra]|uniref:Uncharacterized protein n=1 Tax=Halomarina rubra TaxID=2071873 RepID=A0ABD6AQE1_9EURY|nr:hypothetical protein [Halomarina rubra]